MVRHEQDGGKGTTEFGAQAEAQGASRPAARPWSAQQSMPDICSAIAIAYVASPDAIVAACTDAAIENMANRRPKQSDRRSRIETSD